jgi:hypothetical protein
MLPSKITSTTKLTAANAGGFRSSGSVGLSESDKKALGVGIGIGMGLPVTITGLVTCCSDCDIMRNKA